MRRSGIELIPKLSVEPIFWPSVHSSLWCIRTKTTKLIEEKKLDKSEDFPGNFKISQYSLRLFGSHEPRFSRLYQSFRDEDELKKNVENEWMSNDKNLRIYKNLRHHDQTWRQKCIAVELD